MIDTRLCKTEEELILAMSYEKNKNLLRLYFNEIFNLESKLKEIQFLLTQEKLKKDKIYQDIIKFENQYRYMIIEEQEGMNHILR